MATNYRYYPSEFPTVNEIVMVKVHQITDAGVYVKLLEYNNIQGLIIFSELSRRRIRSINSLVREGHDEVAVVLRVDRDKGYIDLSKKAVSEDDIKECEERYSKSKMVHILMGSVSSREGIPIEDVYESIAWPLHESFGHAYDAFLLYLSTGRDIFQDISISDSTRELLISNITRRLAKNSLKIRAYINVTCYTYEGIGAIKAALLSAENVHIRLMASPMYYITLNTFDRDSGIEIMNRAIEVITDSIRLKGGNCLLDDKGVHVVNDIDERELNEMMEKLEEENEQIDGDEPLSETQM